MRYRGGGVGHTYMWAIEEWLLETGWGHDIPECDVSEPHVAAEGEGQSQDPTQAEDGSDSGTGSDSDDQQGDGDSDQDNEEETMEGEFGYSTF